MNATLSSAVADLSREEKLALMELLWESLADTADDLDVPASHEAELQNREQRIAEGKASFSDWEEAKKRIFSAVKK